MAQGPRRLVAHTPPPGGTEWHDLDDHLREVARLASEFAEPFGGQDLAWWAGIYHDLGKAHPDFQEYLWNCHSGGPPRFILQDKNRLEQDLFVRMIFSTLIDADRLNAESHFDDGKSAMRTCRTAVPLLRDALTTYIEDSDVCQGTW